MCAALAVQPAKRSNSNNHKHQDATWLHPKPAKKALVENWNEISFPILSGLLELSVCLRLWWVR
jgi:hypothetical protein